MGVLRLEVERESSIQAGDISLLDQGGGPVMKRVDQSGGTDQDSQLGRVEVSFPGVSWPSRGLTEVLPGTGESVRKAPVWEKS